MPDDERGRTFSACCAACRWWGGFGDGWGECVRPDERCADPACTAIVPPTLMRVVVQQGLACGDGCCGAFLHTEAGFGCRAWEPRDSGPQDAPDSAQGPETPGRGLPSRGGPFPLTRAGVLYGQGGGEAAGAGA